MLQLYYIILCYIILYYIMLQLCMQQIINIVTFLQENKILNHRLCKFLFQVS